MISFIRNYVAADALALTAVHNQQFPDDQRAPQSWHYLRHGRAWLLWLDDELVGFTAVLPVPGLPGVVELEGWIIPDYQRKGLGTTLLCQMQSDLSGSDMHQLSCPVPTLAVPAARFLQKNNFFLEHEECTMILDTISHYQLSIDSTPLTIQTYPQPKTISLFQQLYAESFAGTAWNEPFAEDEIVYLLDEHSPLYFLVEENRPIGFVWVRSQSATAVELEPIGIIKEKQGQGYGRAFLQTLLNQLKREGITTVKIGVWANNVTAVHLYQSLGFQKTSSLYYLACDL